MAADDKAYCMKCKKTNSIKNSKISTTAKNRRILKGNCAVCNTKVNKFLAAKKGGKSRHRSKCCD